VNQSRCKPCEPSQGAGDRFAAGFTLIELMFVVVIVAVLLAVALPSYQNSLQKGRRSDAMSALMDVANRQEQFMLDRSTYTQNMTELGFASDPMASADGFYTVDAGICAAGTIQRCYVLTATPVNGGLQSKDSRCATFILDSTGAKTATGTDSNACW
jgi:type IV pilus assembly protein PilE